MTGQRAPSSLPRPVLAAIVAMPLLLAVIAAIIALVAGRGTDGGPGDGTVLPAAGADSPLVLPAVPAPAAGSPECAALVAALPARLQSGPEQLDRRPLATPSPTGAAAWGVQHTVVLRCGLDRPVELTPTAGLLEVNGVRWLRLPGQDATSTWVAVDRPVYVALTLPDNSGTGPLQDVSNAIGATMAARPVEPAR